MGWLDSHLHAFRIVGSESTFGIPEVWDVDVRLTGNAREDRLDAGRFLGGVVRWTMREVRQ